VIVRDEDEHWSVVLQPDHAELSGHMARAWGASAPVTLASARHDDGWAVWERAPLLAPGTARPQGFLEVNVPTHLAFWRAATAAVVDEDPHAGLLVSMHGTGIYRGRYGTHAEARFGDEVQSQVDAFVAEQEKLQSGLAEGLELDEGERWAGYRLLQTVDRLSLHFCVTDPESGDRQTIERVPIGDAGNETEMTLTPLGPYRVCLDPSPFGAAPERFELLRRAVPKREWRDHASFRRDLWATEPERLAITIEGP